MMTSHSRRRIPSLYGPENARFDACHIKHSVHLRTPNADPLPYESSGILGPGRHAGQLAYLQVAAGTATSGHQSRHVRKLELPLRRESRDRLGRFSRQNQNIHARNVMDEKTVMYW